MVVLSGEATLLISFCAFLLIVVFTEGKVFARIDGWMDDLPFYVLYNSISVISGRC